MANRCGHKGLIDKLLRSGRIKCHKQHGRPVKIVVTESGNSCVDEKCRFSAGYVPDDSAKSK